MNDTVSTEVPIQIGAKYELPGTKILDIAKVPEKDELIVVTKDTIGVTSAIGFVTDLSKIDSRMEEFFIKTIFNNDGTPIFIYQSLD